MKERQKANITTYKDVQTCGHVLEIMNKNQYLQENLIISYFILKSIGS